MTDNAPRCEPPEHLRGVPGAYWLRQNDRTIFAHWSVRDKWWDAVHISGSSSGLADMGYRYLAPVAPPDLVRALVEALEAANQFITNGIELGFIRMPSASTPDSAHKTPGLVAAAIARAKEAGI